MERQNGAVLSDVRHRRRADTRCGVPCIFGDNILSFGNKQLKGDILLEYAKICDISAEYLQQVHSGYTDICCAVCIRELLSRTVLFTKA